MSEREIRQDDLPCTLTGKCQLHDVEIERRKTDRKEINYLKEAFLSLEKSLVVKIDSMDTKLDTKVSILHEKNNVTNSKVAAIFYSLGIFSMIVIGSFYYTRTVDVSSSRGRELIIDKVNTNEGIAKEERTALVQQVISLLTSDASNKEWQRGVIRQLEQINVTVGRALDKAIQNNDNSNNGTLYNGTNYKPSSKD